ncbi:MAG: zinc-ribbon domain containing protein, partial [Bacteroidota bacterium]
QCSCCKRRITTTKMRRTFSLLPYEGFFKAVDTTNEEAFFSAAKRYPSLYQWACDDCINGRKAILASPNKQFYTFKYPWDTAIPFLAYFDKGYTCVSCGEKGILSKEIQQHWYEELQLVVYTKASSCKKCRVARDLNTELSNLLKDGKPNDASLLMRISEIYEAMGKTEKMKAYRRAAEKIRSDK